MAVVEKPAAVPSLVFELPQIPPEPRVLPNVIDAKKRPDEPLQMPIDIGREWRAGEQSKLNEYKLRDPETGLPMIPDDAIAYAQRTAGGGVTPTAGTPRPVLDGTRYEMPSEASGGLRSENKLQ